MKSDWIIRRTMVIVLVALSMILIIVCGAAVDTPGSNDPLIISRSFDLIVILVTGYIFAAATEDTIVKVKGSNDVA